MKRFTQSIFSITAALLIVVFSVNISKGAALGDYRTAASGNWNSLATWEYCTVAGTPGTWAPAIATPTSANNVITIRNTHTVTVTANLTADQVVVDAGGQITVNSGVIFTVANGTGVDLTVSGTVNDNGSIPGPNEVTINTGGAINVSGSLSTTGNGKMTVNSGANLTLTGSGTVAISSVSTLTVSGTLTMSGSSNISVLRGNGGSVGTLNSGGLISMSGTASFSNNSGASGRTFSFNSGSTLRIGPTAILNGSGEFDILSGANFEIGSTAGIALTGASGNVQSSYRSYATGANYTYNGTSAQVTGTGLTSANNLIIDNAAGVKFSNTLTTVNGNLTINTGRLLTIEAGKQLTVAGAFTNNAGSTGLLVQTDGSLIQNSTGIAATVKRDIINTKSHFLSSPVAVATFGSVFSGSMTTWAREWNPLSNSWVYKTSLNPFVTGKGYCISTTTPTIVATFAGTLNNTDVTSTLSNANGGWNLLGNPFTSAIDWDNLVKGAGVGAAVSVWNGTNYVTWNGSVGGLTGGIIPAENGFFVTTTINGATLTVPLTARLHSVVAFYKERISNVLELQANGNDGCDQLFIHFNDDATAAYDNQYDARKRWGEDYAPQLYSIIPADVLAINELPFTGNETVDLGFRCNTDGDYSLTALQMESFDANTPIVLEDTKTNSTQDLRENPVYRFSYVAGENAERFRLHFKSSDGINDTNSIGISVYCSDQNVIINNPSALSGEVWVYNMTGQVLVQTKLGNQVKTIIPLQATNGTFIVKVVTARACINHKVFIR